MLGLMPPYPMRDNFEYLHFKPWIGLNYDTQGREGLRILVLGESHYTKKHIDKPPEESTYYTRHIIQWAGVEKNAHFYAKVRNLILRGLDQPVSGYQKFAKRQQFWDSVAFFNYVQEFVGTAPKQRPLEHMWEDAKPAFVEAMGILKPDVCIALGKTLWQKLPCTSTSDSIVVDSFKDEESGIPFKKFTINDHTTLMTYTCHPSSMGHFKKQEVVPIARRLFESGNRAMVRCPQK